MNTAASSYCLDHVANNDLHESARRLVGRSNQVLAALLAHLAEVETRGIHRERASASLYTYCIYELRMSEDAAFRRARAAKIARQFPILFEQIAAGEIHLSGVLMLGPILTEANHREVLALAKHRTKRELTRLVRLVSPLADARCVVEPLGPARSQPLIDQYGDIRELERGDRPRDWIEGDSADLFAALATGNEDTNSGANTSSGTNSGASTSDGADTSGGADMSDSGDTSGGADMSDSGDTSSDADTKSGGGAGDAAPPPLLVPQRYMIQFTAPQEYVDLLEKAKNLSAYETRSIVEIHLRAMRAFVAELEKRRCGATSKRRTKSANALQAETTDPTTGARTAGSDDGGVSETIDETIEPRQRGETIDEKIDPRQRGEGADLQAESEESADLPRQHGDSSELLERDDTVESSLQHGDDGDDGDDADSPRRRGRYVPPAVRRAVWQRDEGRCTYVDDRGVRCRETACLELDHDLPHARGGPPTVKNLRLRCRSHNHLTAESEFGREFMDRKRWTGTALPELAPSGSVAGSG